MNILKPKLNKFWGSQVQYSDYILWYYIAYLQVSM